MKQKKRTLLWLLASFCLLLANCSKTKSEEPAPNLSADYKATSVLQELFVQKQYDQQINRTPANGTNTIRWEPQWQATIWSGGANREAYVPLQAQHIKGGAQDATIKGVMVYLRFRQKTGIWTGKLFSCFYKLSKGDISNQPALALTPSLLSSFTGDVFARDMQTGEELHSLYNNGVWQKPAAKKVQGMTSSCKQYYSCMWFLYCHDKTAGPGAYYNVIGETCDEPTGYTLGCGYETQYELVQQTYDHTACDDPNDPTTPDPNNPNAPGATTLVDGVYVLMNMAGASQSRALAIANNSTAAQATAIINTQPGNPSVSWRLTSMAGGYYTLTSINSGLMLDVQWGSTADGTPIWQYAANGGNAQQWQIQFVGMNQGDSMYKVISRQSGLVLGLNGAAPSNGTPVVQTAYTGSSTQHWSVFYIGQ